MTTSLNRLAQIFFERQKANEQEWDELPKRAVQPDRFRSCSADQGFIAGTHFKVTDETFAREQARKGRDIEGDSPDAPPPGLVCSARLGEVSKLL